MNPTFTETWTGTNGAAWPAEWTTAAPTGGSNQIQSNAGRQVTGTTPGQGPSAFFNPNTSITDFDLTITGNLLTALSTYSAITFRADAMVANRAIPNNGYGLLFNVNAAGSFQFYGFAAGAPTGLGSAVAISLLGDPGGKMRLRVVGSSLKAKMWRVTDPEPTAWDLDITEGTYTSGRIALGDEESSLAGSGFAWDDLSLEFLQRTPWKVQDIGNQVSNSAATTTVISYTGALKPVAGDLVTVYCARDNVGTDPLTGDSFTDSNSNTYTRVVNGSNVTSAGAGVVGVMFYSVLTTGWSAGTNTLTWTHPSTIGAMRMEHWTNVSGLRPSGSNTATSTAGAPSVAVTTPQPGDLVLGMEAIEYSTAGTSTADADSTNGSWSALQGPTATTGTTLAAVKVISQSKVVTAAGTQTFNPTHSVTTNVDTVAIVADFVPLQAPPPARRTLPQALLAR